MAKKTSKAPDYTELAGVSREAVGVARDLGQQQIDFSERQYEELKPIMDSIAQSQVAAQTQQMQQAKDYYDYQVSTFRPVEQQLVSDAQRFNTDSYRQLMAGDAAAASARAFGSIQGALTRADAARGINPNSPAARALRQQAAIGLAAQSAGAQTAASVAAEQRGQAYMQSAAGLGRGLPGASTAAYQGATAAGSAGAGTYMAPGNQYMAGLGAGAGTMMGGYQTGIQGLTGVLNAQTSVYGADQERAGAVFGGLMGLGGAALGASSWGR